MEFALCCKNNVAVLANLSSSSSDDGSVYSFGENKLGQLGQGSQTYAVLSPALVSNLVYIVCICQIIYEHPVCWLISILKSTSHLDMVLYLRAYRHTQRVFCETFGKMFF